MDHQAIALKTAQDTLTMYEGMEKTMPNMTATLAPMIADARAKVARLTPVATMSTAAPTTPAREPQEIGQYLKAHDERIAALEQLVQRVAAPAINEAAQTGAIIMEALGKAMSADQAAWVKTRLDTSPEFFATPDCHEAVSLFIAEWRNFEERKAK